MRKLCILVLCLCGIASAENFKLYLKDGTDQLVSQYKIEGDRVSYYSVEREDWEQVPLSLVDLDKTKAQIKEHVEEVHAEAAAEDAEEKAERAARKEVERVPVEPGVYLIEEQKQGPDKLTPLKVGESKIVTSKGRSILRIVSQIPFITGKATLELDGKHAPQGTANRTPEFYFRLSEDERFGMVRLSDHKGNRTVERITTQPVTGESEQKMDSVDVFRQQVGDMLFKVWPQKPLDPGEYALVQYNEGKIDTQVWDFFIAPGTGK